MKFTELNLNEKTLGALEALGYKEPTEVQIKTIPEIIKGKNLVVRSQTGTGKTAAFGIGLVERLANGDTKKALILTPTRELAIQVCKEVKAIGKDQYSGIFAVYGGQSINTQINDLKGGYEILVATPGRLLDLNRRGIVRMNEFETVVLDEADHMLDLGFQDEMTEVLDALPKEKLMILLSATIDESIMSIASKHIPEAQTIEVGEKEIVSTIREEHVETTQRGKLSQLVRILQRHAGIKTLIFMETKRGTSWLTDRLKQKGLQNVGILQGDMSQASRNSMIELFKKGKLEIMVATNVAARGLHIDDLGLIINYDQAESDETHLHRVGRTGRMGSTGRVINFIIRRESREERMREDHPDFAWMKEGYTERRAEHTEKYRPRRDSNYKPKNNYKRTKGKGRR
ncbi:DEAD/DEAH box helicase [Candidatus Micrarchaeota archaeon]|nr:DEAD/DEAH box helicase [Candidatus Micrarchaeota archaeon]